MNWTKRPRQYFFFPGLGLPLSVDRWCNPQSSLPIAGRGWQGHIQQVWRTQWLWGQTDHLPLHQYCDAALMRGVMPCCVFKNRPPYITALPLSWERLMIKFVRMCREVKDRLVMSRLWLLFYVPLWRLFKDLINLIPHTHRAIQRVLCLPVCWIN